MFTVAFVVNFIAFIGYLMLCFYVTSDKFYSMFIEYLRRHRGL